MEDIVKVIFQLEADSSKAIGGLQELNSKYKESNAELKRSQQEVEKLMAREAQLLSARSKANNPSAVARYNNEIQKTQEQIRQINTSLAAMTKAEQVATASTKQFGDSLTKALDATKANALNTELTKVAESTKKVGKESVNAFTALRTELKKAKGELAAAFSSGNQDQIIKASKRVGELKDQMNDLNETTNAFASGSKFQQIGNLFGDIGRNLLSLDFGRANEQSKALLATTKAMTFAEAGQGIKDLGASLLNVGKSLLANPLFLLAAGAALILSNLDAITEHFGIFTSEVERNTRALAAMEAETKKVNATLDTQVIALENNIKKLKEQNAPLQDIIKSYKELQGLKFTQINNDITTLTLKQENLRKQLAKDKGVNARARVLGLGLSNKEREDIKNQIAEIDAQLTDLNNQRLQAEITTTDSINAETKRRDDEQKKLRDERFAKEKAESDARIKAMQDFLAAKAEEEEFYANRAAQIDQEERDREVEQARQIIEIEKKKQERLRDLLEKEHEEMMTLAERWAREEEQAKKKSEDEAKKEEEERKEEIKQTIEGIQAVSQATIKAIADVQAARVKEKDKQIDIQRDRIEETKGIADKGNAEMLEMEKKRLEDLNKEKEKFVRRQQTLAVIELVTNSSIAIAKAAAQGGAAAPFTIAATLISLISGLAQAKALASQAAFYEGGYTGDGDPHAESLALGKKSYTYHKGEFVFNHEKTGKYRDIFEGIHKGNIDLVDWKRKVDAFESSHAAPIVIDNSGDVAELSERLDKILFAMQRDRTELNFDENGFTAYMTRVKTRNDFIKNNLARI